MKEYIEREALIRQIDSYFDQTNPSLEEQLGVLQCRRIVRGIPAADVVEVVRCKDCKWWTGLACININGANIAVSNPIWFCCAGKRREENAVDQY